MTRKDKQLLLVDLCSRMPYGVKVKNVKNNFDINNFNHNVEEIKFLIEEYGIKPYLRPMLSMTEEEKTELGNFAAAGMFSSQNKNPLFQLAVKALYGDFFNKHHIDYRGLIPMGLALEAPEGMYKTE